MTEPTTNPIVILPNTICKDCIQVQNIVDRQKENVARIVVIEGVLPLKVAWAQLRWILGGLCAAVILVVGANFALLTTLNGNQHRLEINQVELKANQEALKIKIDTLHKVENKVN